MNSLYGVIPFIYTLFKSNNSNIQIDSNNEIISRLKFIARIKNGEKINVGTLSIQHDDLSTSFSRTFYNKDNRHNTLRFIRNTIDRSFELINFYYRSSKLSEQLLSRCIIEDLELSKKGIFNLKTTYSDDVKFCCDLDTILQHINAILLEFNKEEKEIEIENNENKEQE